MNKNVVLSNLLFVKKTLSNGYKIEEETFERLRRAIEVALEAMHEQPEFIAPENERDALNMMIRALQPFTAIMTPDYYKDQDAVAVEIAVPKEFVENYVVKYDEAVAAGNPPPNPRPDLDTKANWPTHILNVEGINIGDIRFAKTVLEAITIPTGETVN